MSRFRFIHAADIHLGSLISIDGMEARPELQELCYKATYKAFDNICQLAVKSEADFILLSGDVYDQEYRSVRANRFFADCCKMLDKAGIQIYVLAGNHDPVQEYREMFKLPENTYVFSADKPEVYYFRDKQGNTVAAIAGQSYKSRQAAAPLHLNYPEPEGEMFRIAMLHTQLEPGNSKYIPSSLGELAGNSFFDYWALGHIHKPMILRFEKPAVLYAGTPQGRDFGEQNTGGCWLIEVDRKKVDSVTYWATSPVEYQSIKIDISCPELRDAESLYELEDYMISRARQVLSKGRMRPVLDSYQGESRIKCLLDDIQPEGFILRWEITGRGRLHSFLQNDRQGSEQELCENLRNALGSQKPFIWTDSVKIRTADPITDKVLDRHPTLKQLLEYTVHSLKDQDIRRNFVSQLGEAWSSSFNHEEQDDERFYLDEDTLNNIIEDAVQLLLEGLAEGEEA